MGLIKRYCLFFSTGQESLFVITEVDTIQIKWRISCVRGNLKNDVQYSTKLIMWMNVCGYHFNMYALILILLWISNIFLFWICCWIPMISWLFEFEFYFSDMIYYVHKPQGPLIFLYSFIFIAILKSYCYYISYVYEHESTDERLGNSCCVVLKNMELLWSLLY